MAFPDLLDTVRLGMAAPPPMPQAPAGQTPAPSGDGNWFTSGVSSGFHGALADVGGFGQAVAQAVGAPGAAGSAQGYAQSQRAQAAAAARPDLEANPWSLPGVGYQIAKGLPGMGVALGAGALAALGAPEEIAGAAGAAGLRGWLASQTGRAALGAGAATYPMAVGENVDRTENENGPLTQGSAVKALAYGVPEAGVQAVLPAWLEGQLGKKAAGTITDKVIRGALEGTALQVPAAAANEALMQQMGDPNRSFADRAHSIVQSALGGALQGAVFGGAFGGLRGQTGAITAKPAEAVTTDELNQITSGIDPNAPRITQQRTNPPSDQQVAPAAPQPTGLETILDQKLSGLYQTYNSLKARGQTLPPDHETMHQNIAEELFRRYGQGPRYTPGEPDGGVIQSGDANVIRGGAPDDMLTRRLKDMPDDQLVSSLHKLIELRKITDDDNTRASASAALQEVVYEMKQRAQPQKPQAALPPPLPPDPSVVPPEAPPEPPAPETPPAPPFDWKSRRQALAKADASGETAPLPKAMQGQSFKTDEEHQAAIVNALQKNPTPALVKWATRAGVLDAQGKFTGAFEHMNAPEAPPTPPGLEEPPAEPTPPAAIDNTPTGAIDNTPTGAITQTPAQVAEAEATRTESAKAGVKPVEAPAPVRQEGPDPNDVPFFKAPVANVPDALKFHDDENLTGAQLHERRVQQATFEIAGGTGKHAPETDVRARLLQQHPDMTSKDITAAIQRLHDSPMSGFNRTRPRMVIQNTDIPAMRAGTSEEARSFPAEAQARVRAEQVAQAAPKPKTQKEAEALKAAQAQPPVGNPIVSKAISDATAAAQKLTDLVQSKPRYQNEHADLGRGAVAKKMLLQRLGEIAKSDNVAALRDLPENAFNSRTAKDVADYAAENTLPPELNDASAAYVEAEEKVKDAIKREFAYKYEPGADETPSVARKNGMRTIAELTPSREPIKPEDRLRSPIHPMDVRESNNPLYDALEGVRAQADQITDNPYLKSIYDKINELQSKLIGPIKIGERSSIKSKTAGLKDFLDATKKAQGLPQGEPVAAPQAAEPVKQAAPELERPTVVNRWEPMRGNTDTRVLEDRSPPSRGRPQEDRIADTINATNSGREMLRYFSRHGSNSFYRAAARMMQRFDVNPTIRFADPSGMVFDNDRVLDPDMEVYGSYNAKQDRISIYTREHLETTVMHELFHAATLKALRAGGKYARQVQDIFDKLSKQFPDEKKTYGLTNAKEMLSEYISNPIFRKFAESTPLAKQTFGQKLAMMLDHAITGLLNIPGDTLHVLQAFWRDPAPRNEIQPRGWGRIPSVAEALERNIPGLLGENQRAQNPDALDIETPSLGSRGGVDAAGLKRNSQVADDIAASAGRNIGRIISDKSLNFRENFRKFALGWVNGLHIDGEYGRIIPAIKKFVDLQREKENRDDIFARPSVATQRAMDALPANTRELVNELKMASSEQVDPTKSWNEHTHLHGAPNEAVLRERVLDYNKKWNDLKSLKDGGVDAYLMSKANHSKDFNLNLLWSLKNIADQFDGGIPGIDDVFAKYVQQTGMHSDPIAIEKWTANELKNQLGAMSAFRDRLSGERGVAKSQLTDALNKGDVPTETIAGMRSGIKRMQSDYETVTQLLDAIKEKQDQNAKAPYFPLGRDGTHFVSATLPLNPLKQPNPAVVDKLSKLLASEGFGDVAIMKGITNASIYARVRNAAEARHLQTVMMKAREMGLLDKGSSIGAGDATDPAIYNSITPAFMRQAIEQFRASAPEIPEGTDPKTAALMTSRHFEQMRDMQNALLNLLPETSMGRLMARREYVQGFSKQMDESSRRASANMARSLSRLSLAADVGRASAEMAQQVKANNHNDAIPFEQKLAGSQAVAELMLREKLSRAYVPHTPLDVVRHLTHMLHIGSSPAYFLTLMSQIGTTSWPELAKTHGFGRGAQALYNAANPTFQVMRAIASSPDWMTAGITQEALEKAGIPPATVKFIMQGVARSIFTTGGYSREMMKGSEEGMFGHGAGAKFKDAMNMLGLYAELVPRLQTAFAARELYASSPEKALVYGKPAGLHDFVAHTVRQSQGDWTGSLNARQTSRGGMFGAMSPMINQFMGWQINMTAKLYREAHGMVKGDAASWRWMGAHAAAVATLAGTLGLPLLSTAASVFDRLADFATDRDDWDVTSMYRTFLANTFGKDMGEIIARGVPRAAGMDFDHWGEGTIVPGSATVNALMEKRKIEDAEKDWLKSMGGSSVGEVMNYATAVRDITNGDLLDGLIKMVPEFMKTPMEGYRLAQRGFVDKNGMPLPITANAYDVAMTVLGIDPEKEAEYNEVKRAETGLNTMRQLNEQNITRHLMLAQQRHDPSNFQAWMGEAQKYMGEHPGMTSPIQDYGRAFAGHLRAATLAKGLGLPIGVSPRDIAGRGLLSYGNFGNQGE